MQAKNEKSELEKAREFFDYEPQEGRKGVPKSSFLEFFQQLGSQAPMQAVGSTTSAIKGLTDIGQRVGAGQEQAYPEQGDRYEEQPNVSEQMNLPTAEYVGKKIGYEEPTTGAGRIGKRIGGAIGSAIPMSAGMLATGGGSVVPAAINLASSAIGGAAGGLAKEAGASEGMATAVDVAGSLSLDAYALAKKILKPSGLVKRGFEKEGSKIQKISPTDYESLKGKIEDEVKDLSEEIFLTSKNYEQIKNAPSKYYEELNNGLERVEHLAGSMPLTVKGSNLQTSLDKQFTQRKFPPITHGESDTAYIKKFKELKGSIDPKAKTSLSDLIKQYRANNKELKGLFNMAESTATNSGKRDALLSYNRAISEEISNKVPNSQLNDLFKKTNKMYSDAANIEKVDAFIESVFKGNKIDYNTAKEYLKHKDLQRSVRGTFGDVQEKKFRALVHDLVSQEKGMSKLRPSETKNLELLKLFNPGPWKAKAHSILRSSPMYEGGKTGIVTSTIPTGISKVGQYRKQEKHQPTMDEILSRED